MTSTHADALPMPGSIATRDAQVVRQGQGCVTFTAVANALLSPRTFQLVWTAPRGEVADAVLRHYDDHFREAWALTLPRTGEVVKVKWIACPTVRWRTPKVAESIEAQVEEVLAHE
jgi:hypothetical protein